MWMTELVDQVLEIVNQFPKIEKVLLFGSRARGDAGEKSDYDLAFDIPDFNHEQWSHLAVKIDDEVETLLELDLVWLQELKDQKFKAKINQEGQIIFGTLQKEIK